MNHETVALLSLRPSWFEFLAVTPRETDEPRGLINNDDEITGNSTYLARPTGDKTRVNSNKTGAIKSIDQ